MLKSAEFLVASTGSSALSLFARFPIQRGRIERFIFRKTGYRFTREPPCHVAG